jgi:hypothetical protein
MVKQMLQCFTLRRRRRIATRHDARRLDAKPMQHEPVRCIKHEPCWPHLDNVVDAEAIVDDENRTWAVVPGVFVGVRGRCVATPMCCASSSTPNTGLASPTPNPRRARSEQDRSCAASIYRFFTIRLLICCQLLASGLVLVHDAAHVIAI